MKKLLLIPGLLFSVCTFASPCDNSTLQIINNSDVPMVVENVKAGSAIKHGGTITGIEKNQVIDAHSNVTAFISSGSGSAGMASGHIDLTTQSGGHATLTYSLSANPAGWASTCKVKGNVKIIDSINATVDMNATSGNPGKLQFVIKPL